MKYARVALVAWAASVATMVSGGAACGGIVGTSDATGTSGSTTTTPDGSASASSGSSAATTGTTGASATSDAATSVEGDATIATSGDDGDDDEAGSAGSTGSAAGSSNPWDGGAPIEALPDSSTGITGGNGMVDAGSFTAGTSNATLPTPGTTVTVATTGGDAVAIVGDGQNVFWSDGQKVLRAPSAGGMSTLLATTQAFRLALDGNYLYFADQVGIERVAKTGSDIQTIVAGTGVSALSIANETLYWEQTSGGDGELRSLPIGGTNITTLSTLEDTGNEIAIAGPVAYSASGYSLYVINLATGGTTLVRDSSGTAVGCYMFASDGVAAFCGDVNDGTIVRVGANGSLATLATGIINVDGVACDGTYIYWADQVQQGNVSGMAISGTATTQIATDTMPSIVAADGTYVYWAANGFLKSALR